jgi:hypothetical protein
MRRVPADSTSEIGILYNWDGQMLYFFNRISVISVIAGFFLRVKTHTVKKYKENEIL